MQKYNLKRFISLTGTGARTTGDKPSLIDRILNQLVNFIDPIRISDGNKHVIAIKHSDLNWTILRVLVLTNGELNINYKLNETGPSETLSSRKKVAKIMVDLLTDKEYIKKMPIICG